MEKVSWRKNHKFTLKATYIASASQAIAVNFAPLLFLTFQESYDISLTQVTLLITLNFLVQFITDFAASGFVDKIGYRVSIIAGETLIGIGLLCLALLPELLPEAYTGLIIATVIYACGCGLVEILVSPMVEACPTDRKEATMSMLHSFYCWGSVAAILLSTAFFAVFGVEHWGIICMIWAIIPLLNALFFTQVPVYHLQEGTQPMSIQTILSSKLFWVFVLLMVCAGAAELGMAQWASAFSESALGVSKTVGDLAGPCLFAILMGLSRLLYSKFGDHLELSKVMLYSGVLCILCYLLAGLSNSAILGFIGCAVCGFSVGMLWPGTFSLAAVKFPLAGTTMFAYLSLAGDVGCMTGPTVVGVVSDAVGGSLSTGLLVGAIFPTILVVGLVICLKIVKNAENTQSKQK